TARGVTPDGLGSGGYAMWRCDLDDSELVFGQGARERALQAKERECAQLAIEANQAQQDWQHLNQLFSLVEAVKPVHCAELIRDMLQLHRQVSQAESALTQLDLNNFQELEGKLENLRTQLEEQDALTRQLSEEAGSLKQKEQQYEVQLKKLADEQDGLQQVQEALESAVFEAAKIYPQLDADTELTQAEQRARQAGKEHQFNDDIRSLDGQLETIERTLFQS